jgi:hypothetical protein
MSSLPWEEQLCGLSFYRRLYPRENLPTNSLGSEVICSVRWTALTSPYLPASHCRTANSAFLALALRSRHPSPAMGSRCLSHLMSFLPSHLLASSPTSNMPTCHLRLDLQLMNVHPYKHAHELRSSRTPVLLSPASCLLTNYGVTNDATNDQ